jgi:hypothetical protein
MSHFNQAKSWLQARYIEHSHEHDITTVYTETGARDATNDERHYATIPVNQFHDFLIQIGASLQEVLRKCEIAGLIIFMEAGFSPKNTKRFYCIQSTVMLPTDEPTIGNEKATQVPKEHTSLATKLSEPRKSKRGRPIDTNLKEDKRIYEAWKTKSYKKYSECDRALGLANGTTYSAVERHRKRLERKGRNRRTK